MVYCQEKQIKILLQESKISPPPRDDATQIHPISKLDDNLLNNLGKFM